MIKPVLSVENITVGYSSNIVLSNLSFEYSGTGIIQILGPNGSGKSTLLKTITGLLKPWSGKIIINNVDVTGNPSLAGKYVGYVPQLSLIEKIHYPITLYELITCCYILGKKWPRIRISEYERKRMEKLLLEIGLPRSKWFKRIDELSGGEIQRGYIARALVRDPPIILLDEPFSSIDPEGRIELSKKIVDLSKKKLLLITSHDPTLLLHHTSKILLINRKTYFYGDPEEVLREEMLEKIYGKAYITHNKHIHILDSHI